MSQTRTIPASTVPELDWSKCSLPLGVRLAVAADEEWLPLGADDWKILHGVLTRALPVVSRMVDGKEYVVGYLDPIASNSFALGVLAEVAQAIIDWHARTNHTARPEGSAE